MFSSFSGPARRSRRAEAYSRSAAAQRGQSSGYSASWPTPALWVQQRAHFGSADGSTSMFTPANSVPAQPGPSPETNSTSETMKNASKCWPEMRRIVASIPEGETVRQRLADLGAKQSLADLGVPEEKLPELLRISPLIRNRLTLMRTRRMLDL